MRLYVNRLECSFDIRGQDETLQRVSQLHNSLDSQRVYILSIICLVICLSFRRQLYRRH